ncbi:MAG: rane fusion protein multidrug efflux system [Gammaproteobacteria bacterium]|jgi:multidrug efflux system membrane fusion protein|nr:rane fusion protein multidrug efflux system [Gammaproteobacteria bacterium]
MSEAQETRYTKTAKGPRQGRMKLILAGVAAVLVIFVAWHLISRKPAVHGAAPQVVQVARAARGDMPETLMELGTVTPNATVTVLPQLSGYLTEVGYQEGQEAVKGQFLAQIDPRQYEIDLQQARAQLLKDQAVLTQARSDLARYHQLRAQKAIAEQTVTDQEFIVQQDEATVKTDQANIAQYQLDLVYCHITAPVSGRVGLRLVDPGNYVTASSSTGIVVITTLKPTTVEFTVAQNDLAKVIERFNAGATLPVTAYSSDNTRKIATGALYAISNQMTTSTGTVTLRATFPNDDEALFPNEFVNVEMLVDTLSQVVLLPTPAVLSGAPGDYVYLVNADNTVSVRKVTVGPSDGKNTAILAGISVGDTVVTDGTDRLSNGAKISAADARSTADAAPSAPKSAPGAKRTSGTPARVASPSAGG